MHFANSIGLAAAAAMPLLWLLFRRGGGWEWIALAQTWLRRIP
jgi:hypothetical protein